jgi:alpha,alpha-trehalose phosphorylase
LIHHESFRIHPWAIQEVGLPLEILSQSESVFSLANGNLGLRGNLDEGDPHGLTGTYLAGFYDYHPLPHAESAYGYPSIGQAIVNAPDAKLIRLLVDDEPLDVTTGSLESHSRQLDMRKGVLERSLVWTSPSGRRIKVHSSRLVSLAQKAIMAIKYSVTVLPSQTSAGPGDEAVPVVVQSGLVTDALAGSQASRASSSTNDPRAGSYEVAPLDVEDISAQASRLAMLCRTRSSGLRAAVTVDHLVARGSSGLDVGGQASQRARQPTNESAGSSQVAIGSQVEGTRALFNAAGTLGPGESLEIVKLAAYEYSDQAEGTGLRDEVSAALVAARQAGWEGLAKEQARFLRSFWQGADVELDGDPEVQQAIRFALFHVLQSAARAERNPIPAKGLTGTGYEGHVFWDMESYVLPVLTYLYPKGAKDAIHWRHSTLKGAKDQASELGLQGAAFPWRTINGQPSSGYWPASTAAMHINADIADAVVRYVDATEDRELESDIGVELLVDTARLWASLSFFDDEGISHIDGVTGPDEYSALVDDNLYTNLMARANLLNALDVTKRHPTKAQQLRVSPEEQQLWQRAAESMHIPYDETLQVHPQDCRFTRHERFDFEHTDPSEYPLLLNRPYFELYRKQVVKQADLVMAMYTQGDVLYAGMDEEQAQEQKARDFAYYEEITVRDSSLSACIQAVVATEVGQVELAWDYVREAALMDLEDLECNTSDGLHIASLAGTWTALVAGLAGMRAKSGQLSFAPRLPKALSTLALSMTYKGYPLKVSVRKDSATYELGPVPLGRGSLSPPEDTGKALSFVISHHGTAFDLAPESSVTLQIPQAQEGPRPVQPRWREPKWALGEQRAARASQSRAGRGEPAHPGQPAGGPPAGRERPARKDTQRRTK